MPPPHEASPDAPAASDLRTRLHFISLFCGPLILCTCVCCSCQPFCATRWFPALGVTGVHVSMSQHFLIQHLVPMCGGRMGGAHNKRLPRGPRRLLEAGLNQRWPFLLNNCEKSHSSHNLQATLPDMPVLGAGDSRWNAGHRQCTVNPVFVLFFSSWLSHSKIISSAWSYLPWSLYGWAPSFLTSDFSQRSLLS